MTVFFSAEIRTTLIYVVCRWCENDGCKIIFNRFLHKSKRTPALFIVYFSRAERQPVSYIVARRCAKPI